MMTNVPWMARDAFGARLREEQRRLGYGTAALPRAAEAFGVASPYDRDHVRRWQARIHGPRLDALAYLAHLGFDIGFLTSGQRCDARLQPADGLGNQRWPLEVVDALPAPLSITPLHALPLSTCATRSMACRRCCAT
jgi:hypothetical protein